METTDETTSINTSIDGVISVRHTSAGSYLLNREDDLYQLFQIDSELVKVAESKEPIHGPIDHPLGQLFTIERELVLLDDNQTLIPFDDSTRLSCLRNDHFGGAYACVDPDIFSLNDDATFGPPLFALNDILEPDYSNLDEEEALGCELEWLDLVADANLNLKQKPETPSNGGTSGCMSLPQNSRGTEIIGLLTLLVGLLWGRRRRALLHAKL